VKNTDKNQSGRVSYSVSEAAVVLGVSIPTLKRMAAEGRLESFRTPGGHLRILAESVEAVREHRQSQPRPVRDASPVLQNRRERLEELTLEAQEHRAKRELAKLRQEEQEEAERQEAEAESREQAAAQREAELEIERERLKRDHTKDIERRQAERELSAFWCRWLDEANTALSATQYSWLSPSQRKELLEGLEAEIENRHPADEPRMATILKHSLESLAEPLQRQQQAQEKRRRVTDYALRNLPYSATEAERMRVTAAIRDALRRLDDDTDECEMRVAAQEAIQPLCQAIKKRLLDEELIEWAVRELPWSRNDRDEARLQRECAEILGELPADASEEEAKEALEPTISEACQEIEERRAQKLREAQKANLIREAVAGVSHYLWRLKQDGNISSEEYWDSDLKTDLQEAVREELQSELSGEETSKEVKDLVREIIDDELE
jgi:excisionase family DNA binding protein